MRLYPPPPQSSRINRFLLLAAVAGIALAMTACGPATPTTTAGIGSGAGAGGASEPPAAPTQTPDPDPPPAPPEPDKRWDLEADHFGDDDATIWSQTSNRSAPFAWDRITADNRDAVKVSVGGQPLPIDNLSYEPAFASDLSGAEWRLVAEVTEGAVVLVLTAQNQRRVSDRVGAIELTNGGTGYTSAPTVSFTNHPDDPDGSGAAATATATDQVASVTITNGGSGYELSNVGVQDYVITFVSQPGNPGSGAAAKTSARWSTVGSVGVTNMGGGYTSVPAVSFTGGSGMGAAAVAVGPTGLRTIVVGTGGSGYTSPPTVTCPLPTGTGTRRATGTAVISSGSVSSVTVTDPGLGYTGTVICTFSNPPSGSQATGGTSVIEDRVLSVRLTNPGVGYGTLPACAITGTAQCVTDYGVSDDYAGMHQPELIVTNPGSGYTAAPDVEFPEPQHSDGIRAQGTAAMTDKVTSITLTDRGSGYSAAPTVQITGGGGNDDATAVARLGTSGYTEFDNLYWARQTLYGKELVIEIAEEETGS